MESVRLVRFSFVPTWAKEQQQLFSHSFPMGIGEPQSYLAIIGSVVEPLQWDQPRPGSEMTLLT